MLMRVLIITVLTLIFISPAKATVELRLEQAFTLPLTGEIYFNDIENNGTGEVLIVSSENIAIYSPLLDEVLFATTIDSTDKYYINRALFEDVNHDGIVDIIIMLRTIPFDPTVITLKLYDGASDFQNTYSVTYISPNSFGTYFQQVRELNVIDWDYDGYNNLIVSFDSISYLNSEPQEIVGRTYIYYSFPDSIIQTDYDNFSISNTIEIPSVYNLGTFIATRHTSYWTGSFNEVPFYETKGVICSNNGSGYTMEMIKPNQCLGGMDSISVNNLSPQCLIDLDPSDEYIQIVSLLDWSQSRLSGYLERYSGSDITLHYLLSSDFSSLQWSIPNDGYYEFTGHLNYPGYLFAISSVDNVVVQFDGQDGSVVDQSLNLGNGKKYWDKIYGDEIPRLVIVNDYNVEIYELGMYSDILDDTETSILPNDFTIFQPYPNPFNASLTISLKLNHQTQTTIEAYNLLGQKVDIIYEDNLQRGEHRFNWNANKFSSGIYLIKVTINDQSVTMKAILLK